jgi:tRNA A-37 threonylcarbamoyl transferase component Bud32
MVDARRCPNCGTELSADAPAGLCPKCLLQAGLASAVGSESERLAATESHGGTPSPGFLPPLPSELAPRFPQLEILELLGQGGMGAVYKARQPGLERLVAVKILPPEAGRDPAFAERFAREARALARLSHPHITNVYDFGQTDGQYYLVMEYVDGVNLRQAMRAGSMSPKAALDIVTQVCEALQFAHEEGVVHRDIKPENILLDKRGRVKIADFGLAKLLGGEAGVAGLTGTQQVMGTLRYMAPEQMEGSRDVDHRADIYSLGVVFYELLTGEVPMGRFQPPSARAAVDIRIDEVVLKSLEREPERRYQHASEVKSDVETIAHAPQAQDASSTVREEALSNKAGRQGLGGVIAAATGLVVVGALLSFILNVGLLGWLGGFSAWWLVGLCGPVIFAGGLAMSRLRFYWLAFAASLLCLLVGLSMLWFTFLFAGLPLAIPLCGGFSLWILMQPKVRAAFARNVPRRERPSGDVDVLSRLSYSAKPTPRPSEESDVDRLVRQMLRSNKGLIAGVRVYRDATGASLSDAHAAVKRIAAAEGISLAISSRQRINEIFFASAALAIGMSVAPHDYGVLKACGVLAYVAFLIAHGLGARRDRMLLSQAPGPAVGPVGTKGSPLDAGETLHREGRS